MECYYCKSFTDSQCKYCSKFLCYGAHCCETSQIEDPSAHMCPCGMGEEEFICRDCIIINGYPGIILKTKIGTHGVFQMPADRNDVSTTQLKWYACSVIIGIIIGYAFKIGKNIKN